jgi:DivIVA domain-containing protein
MSIEQQRQGVILMALTPEDVRNKQFSTAKRKSGYEMDEVDAFLDQVELELGALQRENAELRGRLAAAEQGAARVVAAPVQAPPPPPVAAPVAQVAPAAPAPAQNISEQAVAMLALAQRTAEEHSMRAKIEADDLINSARAKVVELERQGQIDRTALERRVEELRAFEREYRTRLRQHYEAALRDLDGRSDAPAAAAAAAPVSPSAPHAPAPAQAAAPQVAPPAPAPVNPPHVGTPAAPTLTPPPPPPAAPNPFTPPPGYSPPAQG